MNKPTPGPWMANTHKTIIGLWEITQQDEVPYVAVCSERDARLIAAAPDLLSALQACDEAMDYMSEYDIPLTLPGQVKAAIKKATGEE